MAGVAARIGRPRISVVMASYHTGPALAQTAAAVLAAPDVAELVLVDNGNPPEMTARLRDLAAAQPAMRLLSGHGNAGFAKACNLGARAATGDHLLFLNPDAILAPGAASRLAAAGANAARPWIAGARLIGEDGREQRGARRGMLTPLSALAGFTGLHVLAGRFPALRNIHREAEPLPEEPVPIPVVSGAAMMLRADDFAALGGFDEAYFLHVEDIDICRRAAEAGGGAIFVPEARAMHYGSTSDAPALRVEWAKARGFMHYFWKFARGIPGKAGAMLIAPLIAAAIMGRALLTATRQGRARSA